MGRCLVLRLTENDVRKVLSVRDAQEAVEKAFCEFGKHLAQSPPWQAVNVKKAAGIPFRWVASGVAYLEESNGVAYRT